MQSKLFLTLFGVLSLAGATASATGFVVLDVSCTVPGGAPYRLIYSSMSPPSGPVSYQLQVIRQDKQARFPMQPKLVGEGLLLTTTSRDTAIMYARNDRGFLDIELPDNSPLNTKGPVEILCKPTRQ